MKSNKENPQLPECVVFGAKRVAELWIKFTQITPQTCRTPEDVELMEQLHYAEGDLIGYIRDTATQILQMQGGPDEIK